MKRGSRVSFSCPASKNAKTSPPEGAAFTGISSSIRLELVVALNRNTQAAKRHDKSLLIGDCFYR